MAGAAITTAAVVAAASMPIALIFVGWSSWLNCSPLQRANAKNLRLPAASSRSVSNTVVAAVSFGVLNGPSAPETPPHNGAAKGLWLLFASTFATVFLAELGDKTQLATLLLSAQSGQPLWVFLGSALALVASSLVGVLLGQWLSQRVGPQQLERLAGALMLVLGIWIGGQAMGSLLPEGLL
jgi:putative Ca2+/H+ antiporter (TMEM165/GDT1 family)